MNENWEEIIFRALQGECSDDELERLQSWRDASFENEKVYNKIEEITTVGSFLKGIDKLHKKDALDTLLKRIRRNSSLHSLVVRYAAVILLPLLIGGIFVYYFVNQQESQQQIQMSAAKQIVPGGPKAVLYLSDGQVIDLNVTKDSVITDGQTGQRIVLSKERSALNYSQTSKSGGEKLEYNKIVVPRGGEYKLTLSDGTTVWLNSETELEYPLAFGEESRDVRLKGEAFFEVVKDKNRCFNVDMGAATIEVTGTSFNASCYPEDGEYQAVLESGKINLVTSQGVAAVDVGECASYDIVSEKVNIEKVDLKYYTSWRYGTFYFYNTPLSDVVQKLGRWYDVDFEFADESLGDECFSGAALRSKSIDFILELLTSTQSISFKIKDNGTITVYRK